MKSSFNRLAGVFLRRSFLFIAGAFTIFALIGFTTAYADEGNDALRCGILSSFSGELFLPFDHNCPQAATSTGGSGSVSIGGGATTSSNTPMFDSFIDNLINNVIASSTTINLQSGSTTVSGVVNPLTGLDIQVNTPFGGIHLFDPVCKLIIKKITIGGPAASSDFSINVMLGNAHAPGSPQAGSVSGTTYDRLMPGTYTVSETGGPAGYTRSFSGDCDANGIINLPPNGTAHCTITNTFATSTNPGGGGGGTSTTTPPGGGGGGGTSTTTPPSGGGGGGGGGGTPGSGSSGGGGSTGGGTSGGNGPILGGGGFSPGTVAGVSTSTAPAEGFLPQIPNTGFGDALATQLLLLLSATVAVVGTTFLQKNRDTLE